MTALGAVVVWRAYFACRACGLGGYLADAWLGKDRVTRVETPTMGGEDFSFYAQSVPAVFFCLGLKRPGQERHPTLHQPDFDFNDDAMPLGIEMFCRLALAEH